MTVRTVDLNGADWSDGTVLTAADLNDTFGAVTIHRKQFSDSTERTSTSATFADTATAFTLTAPVNAMILGLKFHCLLKTSNGADNAEVSMKIVGSNLGTVYLTAPKNRSTSGDNSYGGLVIDATEGKLAVTVSTSYGEIYGGSGCPALEILDTSTVFTVRIKVPNGRTVSVDEMFLDILYTEEYKED